METLEQHQSPMAQFNYDATYEHHETHHLTIDSEETFEDFFTRQLTLAKEAPLKTHLLRQCYYKVLAYNIEYTSMNQECTDYQLIMVLKHLLSSYSRYLLI